MTSANRRTDRFTPPAAYRWNVAMFSIDLVTCWVAMTFVSMSSILPALVGQLTSSHIVIGLVGTVYNASSLLAPLVVAGRISSKQRKKPYLVMGILASRVPFWAIALTLYLGLSQTPAIMLIVFFVCLSLFAAGDGIGSLAGLDIFARAVPLRQRGRLLGTAQFVSGVFGIGAGVLVSAIIERQPFPRSYALLFTAAGICFIPSLVALALIREPESERSQTPGAQAVQGWASHLRSMVQDGTLRRLVLSRLLVGLMSIAVPFYVGHAQDVLLMPSSAVGAFVIAQTAASVITSPILGVISERSGPQTVMHLTNAAAVLAPAFALVAHLSGMNWTTQAYPFVYLALGIASNSALIGFFNYLIEVSPDGLRPIYIGVSNALLGVIALGPFVGGWLLQTTSYTMLFAATTCVVLLGFIISLRLEPPQAARVRHVDHVPSTESQETQSA
ncbi:MAG: MFS transporter [Chloroflexi bacterium]|nr:MFS transporter [Chloroflexota bacterium]